MTADDAREALGAAIAATGAELREVRAVTREVTGRGVLTRWDCSTVADGAAHPRTFFTEVGRGGAQRAGSLRLEADGTTVDVWAWPHDPELPALPLTTVPEAAAVLVARLGLDVVPLRLDVVAHRPLKRAVVRITTTGGDVFVKVLRPAFAGPLADRHARWLAAGLPVPAGLGWSPSGLVALQALGGVDAAARVGEVAPEALLDGVDELRTRVARIDEHGPARTSLAGRVDWYAEGLRSLGGDDHLQRRVAGFADAVGAGLAAAPPPSAAVVHGDLHLAQVRVAETGEPAVRGLLDIDTAGIGDPADDDAALVVHAVVTGDVRAAAGDASAGAWHRVASLAAARLAADDAGRARRAAVIGAVHVAGHALAGTLPLAAALDRIDALLDERPLTGVS